MMMNEVHCMLLVITCLQAKYFNCKLNLILITENSNKATKYYPPELMMISESQDEDKEREREVSIVVSLCVVHVWW